MRAALMRSPWAMIRSQSFDWRVPCVMRQKSSRASAARMRRASCSAGISSENTATRLPAFTAACVATLSAKAVLPTEGRAASTTSAPGCRPSSFWSSPLMPVGTPVSTLSPARTRAWVASICSMARSIGSPMRRSVSLPAPPCAAAKISCCEVSRNSCTLAPAS